MKTITLLAHKRPHYTAQAISALAEALVVADRSFDKLIFSIDPLPLGDHTRAEVTSVCERAAKLLAEGNIIDSEIVAHKCQLGIAANALTSLKMAFDDHKSDLNLYLEDDAVIMPDAIRVVDWFYRCHGGPTSDYVLFSLCNHRDFRPGKNLDDIPDDPALMAEAAHISAPFAWCTTRWQWPFLEATWDKKVVPPTGYDWSLTYAMRLARRRALHPVLSRCRNIGREGGTHESPETFDKTQLGLAYSDGTYRGPYRIAARFPDSELLKIEPWMRPELEATKK